LKRSTQGLRLRCFHYRWNPPQFQLLRAYPALRDPTCGFFAASFPRLGWLFGAKSTAVDSVPQLDHAAATNANAAL